MHAEAIGLNEEIDTLRQVLLVPAGYPKRLSESQPRSRARVAAIENASAKECELALDRIRTINPSLKFTKRLKLRSFGARR